MPLDVPELVPRLPRGPAGCGVASLVGAASAPPVIVCVLPELFSPQPIELQAAISSAAPTIGKVEVKRWLMVFLLMVSFRVSYPKTSP